MAKIQRFEDIQAWQKARVLTRTIYAVTNGKTKFGSDYGLKDQIRRAAVSIMSNIAEGFARRTDKDFGRFLYIALGSAAEVQSQLYVALDQGYLTDQEFKDLYEAASEAARLTTGFIQYLTVD
jgi:four helix bundle protein